MFFGAILSTVNYRDMGHGMGQRISLKFRPNYFTRKTVITTGEAGGLIKP